ncbi:MAG: type VII secretion protein EssC [Oscillospiraceae bacterium]|nr:type VII secretion protein EssC [Oscillospiraceae bacterium]
MLQVTLIQKEYVNMATLPDKKEGHYGVTYKTASGDTGKINIDGSQNSWRIMSGNEYRIIDRISAGNEKVFADIHVLSDHEVFKIDIDNEDCIIMVEPVVKERCRFKKLFLKQENAKITIGKNKNNSICIGSEYISGNHASVTRDSDGWSVSDNSSTNGTYVNNKRVRSSKLNIGDTVFILGYKFIIGCNFIAANICSDSVTYDKGMFFEAKSTVSDKDDHKLWTDEEDEEYFYRTIKLASEREKSRLIKVESPEPREKEDKQSVLLTMGPSVTMCSASVLIAGYSVLAAYYRGTSFSYVVPSLIMAGSMVGSAVIWPFALNKATRKRKKKEENARRESYTEYINTIRGEIKRIMNDESDYMNETYYLAQKCALLASGEDGKPDKYLWSKNINDRDFLTVSIGTGNTEPDLKIEFPEKKIAVVNDSLSDDLFQLASEERILKNVPLPVSLKDGCICGLTGDREAAVSFTRAAIVQLTSLYSYDELKIVFIYNENEEEYWKYSRWLPHVWNNDSTFRYVAVCHQDIKELSCVIEKEIDTRLEKKEETFPHFLIVAADRDLAEKLDTMPLILKKYKDISFSMITLFGMRNFSDSEMIIDFRGGSKAVMYDRREDSEKSYEFTPDSINRDQFDRYIDSIANIRLDLSSERYKLPTMLTFLEMFRVSRAEHLNCLTRWVDNDPTKSLQTAIGVNQTGDSFYIDLHEKFHGPHGLIAGTTGSGKSETIITLILSLAVNYSPEEVAFVIIDYKGGGLADAFESIERVNIDGRVQEKIVKLPHLIGTVTNLDGATIERSRISIESELKRRQSLFKIARRISNEGTMDIYKYQKLRRNGTELEPLPHLFIVCDEFAELKDQQPDFMDLLISTARIGRSLGVHLILATQKPDSVVSPQIWSNSRFKICLKVQDRSDSMAVINRPEAAEISTTGKFYLQVGYNEFFSMGQSAWCGADYIPSDDFVSEDVESVEMINNTGMVICEKKRKTDTGKSDQAVVSQLVAVRQYLIDISKNMVIRPLWLLPVPSVLSMQSLYSERNDKSEKNILNPVIGKWDDLYNRKQDIMTLNFSRDGNIMVFGSAGSGMGMFFTSLVYSLIYGYSPEEVNIYILDFDSGFLKVFEKAPQTGDVVISEEDENVRKLVASLKDEILRRSKLFAPFGGEYSEYCAHSGEKLPNIVVVLNNFSSFQEEYESCLQDVIYISREGTKRGIYLVVGSSNINVNSRLRQNMNQNLLLRMNDPTDYSLVLGRTGGIIPSAYPGRGIVKYGKLVYEFQTADIFEKIYTPSDDETESDAPTQDPAAQIRELCAESLTRYSSARAKSFITRRPDITTVMNISESADIHSIPAGACTDNDELFRIDLSDKYITFVSSASEDKLSSFAQNLAKIISRDKNIDVAVLDAESSFTQEDSRDYEYVSGSDDFDKWHVKYGEMCIERDNQLYKDESGSYRLPDGIRDVYIIINSFEAAARKSTETAAKLIQGMLGCEIHNIHYIVLDTPEKMNSSSGCYTNVIVGKINNAMDFEAENLHEDWFDQFGIWLGAGLARQGLFRLEQSNDQSSEDTACVICSKRVVGVFYPLTEANYE